MKTRLLIIGLVIFFMNHSINAQTISYNGGPEIGICEGRDFMIEMIAENVAITCLPRWEHSKDPTSSWDVIEENDPLFSFEPLPPFILTGKNIPESFDNTYFRLVLRGQDCGIIVSDPVLIRIKGTTPEIITSVQVSDETPCSGASINLTASPNNPRYSTRWYADASGNTLIHEGGSFETVLQQTTTFFVRNESGCEENNLTEMFEKTIEVKQSIVPEFDNFTSDACIGDEVTYGAVTNEAIQSYSWSFSSGNTAQNSGPFNLTFEQAGPIGLELTTIDENGCEATIRDTTTVHEKPDIIINTLSQPNLSGKYIAAEDFLFSASFSSSASSGVNYAWICEVESGNVNGLTSEGDGANFNQTLQLGNSSPNACLKCTVTAQLGNCETKEEFSIIVQEFLTIPDVLTPNGDEFNQTWNIELVQTSELDASQFNIELYNRNGRCVKGCNNSFNIEEAQNWEANDCPAGAYFYSMNGPQDFKKTGALTIIK